MNEDKYMCPVCGNRIEKKPFPGKDPGKDHSRKRWNCPFCRRPLTAMFRLERGRWKFDRYEAAPFERGAGGHDDDERRTAAWRAARE